MRLSRILWLGLPLGGPRLEGPVEFVPEYAPVLGGCGPEGDEFGVGVADLLGFLERGCPRDPVPEVAGGGFESEAPGESGDLGVVSGFRVC